jgi:hypothetical protein
MKKALSFILGIALIGAVIYLGVLAYSIQALVIPFGIASAVLTPLGFICVTYTFSGRERETLEKLSKVPEIEKLIDEAKSNEEKIKLLREERENLQEIILKESRRQTLVERKENIQSEASKMLKELDAIEAELNATETDASDNAPIEEIRKLRSRISARTKGDIVIKIGSRFITLQKHLILSVPGGYIFYNYLKLITSVTERLNKLDKKNKGSNKSG